MTLPKDNDLERRCFLRERELFALMKTKSARFYFVILCPLKYIFYGFFFEFEVCARMGQFSSLVVRTTSPFVIRLLF